MEPFKFPGFSPKSFPLDGLDFNAFSGKATDGQLTKIKKAMIDPYKFTTDYVMSNPTQVEKFLDLYTKVKERSKDDASSESSDSHEQGWQPMGYNKYRTPQSVMNEMVLGDSLDMPIEMKVFMFYLKTFDCENSSVFKRFKKRVRKLGEKEKKKEDSEEEEENEKQAEDPEDPGLPNLSFEANDEEVSKPEVAENPQPEPVEESPAAENGTPDVAYEGE